MNRLAVIILFLVSYPVFALETNLNGDCIVNYPDFAVFATDWQKSTPNITDPNTDFDGNGVIDINDLTIFADQWLVYDTFDRSPVIQDVVFTVVQGSSYTFSIIATDNQNLMYSVESLPTHGDVYTSTGVQIISVPYELPNNQIKYTADSNYAGSDSFTYGANDGTGMNYPCGGVSIGTANITINLTPVPPTANNSDVSVYTHQTTPIILTATDDGLPSVPGKLMYKIVSYPSNAILQDPKSGAGVIEANNLPYTLSSFGNTVWFTADTNGIKTFQFKANDGGADANSGDSNAATVTVTVIDFTRDSLSFDGEGLITFVENNAYDIVDGWAIDFWVKTRESFTGLVRKIGTGTGYEISLSSGKPKICLYDEGGNLVAAARSEVRANDGQWREVGFTFNTIEDGIKIGIFQYGQDGYFAIYEIAGTFGDFNNTDNLIVGKTATKRYRGDFDKLRFFSNYNPDDLTAFFQGLSGRTEEGEETFFGFGWASDVLFMLNEGAGITITDSKLGLTGTLNDPNLVRWIPFNREFVDVSVQQYYRNNP